MISIFKKFLVPKRTELQKETLVGYSIRDGERSPFRLSREQLRGHSVLFGCEGTGKTTLMAHLANAAIKNGDALVVIDLDGDLAPDLLTQVPLHRAKDVCWIDFNDTARVPGFNVLDVSHAEDPDLIVTNFLHTARGLWSKYWNRDVEDALRLAVRTLLAANRVLVRRNGPQFTLFDIQHLFNFPTFCHRLLERFVTDPALTEWWNNYLEWQSVSFLSEWMAAVLGPLHRLVTEPRIRNILGQSTTTLDLRERLEPGRITFFNVGGTALAADIRRWLAALVADRINLTILARERVAPQCHQRNVVVAVNGALSIPRMDEAVFLKNLQARGASYIVSSWTTRYAEPSGHGLPQAAFANATNLFIFRTRELNAEILSAELGEDVSLRDIEELPNQACYVRTHARNSNILIAPILTGAPLKSDMQMAKKILGGVQPCGRNPAEVKAEWERFNRAWYAREWAA